MAALAQDRNTPSRSGDIREFGVAANAVIYIGALVALNASGYLVPASTATTLKVVGRAEQAVDNTGGANGAVRCRVGGGIYRWANSGSSDAIAAVNIGASCYAVDDQTVALTSGSATRSVAGTIYDVDAFGVWVKHS